VQVRLGALRQVVPDSRSFYFDIVSRGTIVEGARLDLEIVPALLRCGDCDVEWDPAPSPVATHGEVMGDALPPLPTFRCPRCGQGSADVLAGGELEVESIEIETEQEEQPCTA
jgi:hydrogenase nickel incorporation protein HypA/HybF